MKRLLHHAPIVLAHLGRPLVLVPVQRLLELVLLRLKQLVLRPHHVVPAHRVLQHPLLVLEGLLLLRHTQQISPHAVKLRNHVLLQGEQVGDGLGLAVGLCDKLAHRVLGLVLLPLERVRALQRDLQPLGALRARRLLGDLHARGELVDTVLEHSGRHTSVAPPRLSQAQLLPHARRLLLPLLQRQERLVQLVVLRLHLSEEVGRRLLLL
mmetsp:Transcript_53936/g.131887  ORF Transcript_53936/g.131887 Transcript_53936/m.131887 type:complete len:210 (-) Transcript_53936:228-857(-)